MQSKLEALEEATARAGGQSALSRICSVSQAAVWKWLQSSKQLPAEHVLKVEAATGVSRHALRPDIYPIEQVHVPTDDEPTLGFGPVMSRSSNVHQSNRGGKLDGSKAA